MKATPSVQVPCVGMLLPQLFDATTKSPVVVTDSTETAKMELFRIVNVAGAD